MKARYAEFNNLYMSLINSGLSAKKAYRKTVKILGLV